MCGTKARSVGRVGRYGMGAGCRGQPVERWRTHRTVSFERMNGRTAALIIRAQQIPADAVGGQKGGRVLLWFRPE